MSAIVDKIKTRGVDHVVTAPTLEMENVSVAYAAGVNGLVSRPGQRTVGDQYALRDITFRVEAGQQIAVVGPNGAGKSTLFKVIVGTIKPNRGRVHVYGHDPDCHICIAYVPQRSQIDWTFPVTVEDVVMMGRVKQIGLFRWPRKRDWALVRECLERVQAGHLSKKQIGELSGGQQQRIFIARALAQGADLLLLDEPFSGLDAPGHEAILNILENLHIDGVTLMVATHDLNLAAERFDPVMLLNQRIIAYGQAPAVLASQNLMKAYGGHMHVIEDGEENVMLTDTCCDHGEDLMEQKIGGN
jgi:manganese/iron transport system ATP-binding protein